MAAKETRAMPRLKGFGCRRPFSHMDCLPAKQELCRRRHEIGDLAVAWLS